MESSKFIRHTLNRTTLKKTGTKDRFISNPNLIMSLFGYKDKADLDELSLRQPGQRHYQEFFVRNKFFDKENPLTFKLYFYKTNEEWRLAGLGDVIDKLHVTETDELIFEVVKKDSSEPIFYINKRWKPETLIINKCSSKNCDNLNQIQNKSRTSRKNWDWVYNNRCVFWVWDYYANKNDITNNNLSDKIWNDFLGRQLPGIYINNNNNKTVTIEINKVDEGNIKDGPDGKVKCKDIYSLVVTENDNEISLDDELYVLEIAGTDLLIRPRDKENTITEEFTTVRF